MRLMIKIAGLLVCWLATTHLSAAAPLRIGMAVSDDVSTAPAYVAEQLGYFKDAKLDVQLSSFRGGAAAQEALSAGAVDVITQSGAGAGLSVSKGAKQKIVATASGEALGWLLLVSGKSNIKSVKDLADKKVGITVKGSVTDMFALWAADNAGVKIQTISLGGGGLLPSLRNGQVDAIVVWPGLSYKIMQDDGARSLMDFGRDMVPCMQNAYVASQEVIDTRPSELRAALAAIYKGLTYMREPRAWSVEFLKSYAHEDDAKVNDLTFENVVLRLPRDGAINKEWIENALKIGAKTWDMPNLVKVDSASLFTNEFHP